MPNKSNDRSNTKKPPNLNALPSVSSSGSDDSSGVEILIYNDSSGDDDDDKDEDQERHFGLGRNDNKDDDDYSIDDMSQYSASATSSAGSSISVITSTSQALRHTRDLFCSHLVLGVGILAVTAGCSYLAYSVGRQADQEAYRARIFSQANAILTSLQQSATTTSDGLHGIGVAATIDADSQWPFVGPLPLLDQRLKAIGSPLPNYLALTPFVPDEDWKVYTETQQIESESILGTVNGASSTLLRLPAGPGRIVPSGVETSTVVTDLEHAQMIYDGMQRTRDVTARTLDNRILLGVPIFQRFEETNQSTVAAIFTTIPWKAFLEHSLRWDDQNDKSSMNLVIHDRCSEVTMTYEISGDGLTVKHLGYADLHDPCTDNYRTSADVSFARANECPIRLFVYPTMHNIRSKNDTEYPVWYTILVAGTAMIVSSIFLLHGDLLRRWQQRQKQRRLGRHSRSDSKVNLWSFQQRAASVSDINHELPQRRGGRSSSSSKRRKRMHIARRMRSRRNLNSIAAASSFRSKPIAEFHPMASIIFADICGFTAWSSVREPTQVFTLLEEIYNAFDVIARRRNIFKVETIGDCYVAASGIPMARDDHAEAMVWFAYECRSEMNLVTKRLEVVLGPDTADLNMRFGIHSGPVTAGILRGEKSRFQLFGDTVNTAARIESTGERGKIHLSESTAMILIGAGKEKWVTKRDELIHAKGKGMMQTYWLTIQVKAATSLTESTADGSNQISKPMSLGSLSAAMDETASEIDKEPSTVFEPVDTAVEDFIDDEAFNKQRLARMIEWNVDVLQRQLKKIIAMRRVESQIESAPQIDDLNTSSYDDEDTTVLDEVREIIALSNTACKYKQNPETVRLSPVVLSQLFQYVSAIADMYHSNPFHNFEHASHVTQSVTKLLARVVTADCIDYNDLEYKKTQGNAQLHEYTYGITSDPIIQFTCALSALIHDADHTGVPNATLVAEGAELARIYKNKSVAEQNSVDLAWSLLMEPDFIDLRGCIYSTKEEMNRFRQLVVNCVMATDIVDKELGQLRKNRWAKAFALDGVCDDDGTELEKVNRKATIVIEHIIQASDVSHTMQHWHVYIKWNEKLFCEMYNAYKAGRSNKDPSEGWYEGELGFFDFYIVPLAKKLQECGVFGVASDEYLSYSTQNRAEWEEKGHEIVKGYVAKYRR